MPSATFQHMTTIDAAPEAVWDDLQNPTVWESIGPVQKVWDPIIESGVLTGFQWSTDIGGVVYQGTGTATVQDRPDHYELVLDTSEMAGTITVDLTPGNPEGTGVEVALELASKGLLSSMFFPMLKRAIGDGFPDQVEAMARQLGG